MCNPGAPFSCLLGEGDQGQHDGFSVSTPTVVASAVAELMLHQEMATASLKKLLAPIMATVLGTVAPWVAVGVAIGAFIHGYAPEEFMARYASRDNPFAVLIAVIVGTPLHSSSEGIIPIVQALWAKGLPLGTTLAFMMSVVGLSLPETIILRRVLKPRLLTTFVGIVGLGIIIVGYLFNWVF